MSKITKEKVDLLLNTDDSNFSNDIFDEKNQNKSKPNWWQEKNGIYNQKAHVILHYLINGNLRFNIEGAREWCNEYENNSSTLNNSEHDNINLLIHYLDLYFSHSSLYAFDTKTDYEAINKRILNNIYNLYLKETNNLIHINSYCNELEEIVSDMENLLSNNFESIIKKYNLICTICHTKVIINNLREKQDISKKEIIENDNNYLKMLIENLEITDQVTIK